MAELIEGKMIKGSAKAILMEINGENMWIAKGQIECKEGFKAIFAISDWLAWQKGFISDNEYENRKAKYNNNQPKQESLPF